MHNDGNADFELISDTAALGSWCDRNEDARFVTLDTEFERQRTFFAQLCLIQLATPQSVACIDPLGGVELAALFDYLAAPNRTKIMHAGRQDFEVLHFVGAPRMTPIIDTQIAAALAGFAEQIGYADLVQNLLGVTLEKSQTRTNWKQRPLTPAQLHYAADDVRYLAAVSDALTERLSLLGRNEWLLEDCASLQDAEVIDPPVELAWKRVKGLAALSEDAFRRSVNLAAWRENAARNRDLPRSWVLKDAELVALALASPADQRVLSAVLGHEPGKLRRDGEAILEAMNAVSANSTALQPRTLPPTPEERQTLKRLNSGVQTIADELGLNASILLTRREMEQIVRGELPARIVHGWRGNVLGDLLAKFTA
jgi:ribonuclease D